MQNLANSIWSAKLLVSYRTTTKFDNVDILLTDVRYEVIKKSIPMKTRPSVLCEQHQRHAYLFRNAMTYEHLGRRRPETPWPPQNALKKHVEATIKYHLCITWQHTLQCLDPGKTPCKRIITEMSLTDTNRVPALKINDRDAISPDGKVNLLADTLQDIFTTNPYIDRKKSGPVTLHRGAFVCEKV
jgi:hypothetical protein